MGRIITSYRYVIDIIGTDLFTLEELGGVDLEKIKNFIKIRSPVLKLKIPQFF